MTVRIIASAVIAALLLMGAGPTQAPQAPAVEVKSTAEAVPVTREALEKALAEAGVTGVTVEKAELDRDEPVPHWDVELRQGDWEYDAEIARDGTVLETEKEFDPVAPPPETPAEPAPAAPRALGLEDAKSIALAHAGLTAQAVRGLRAEFDLDDGVPEIDVEFYAGGFEYEYEIHRDTGAILSWERDWDD